MSGHLIIVNIIGVKQSSRLRAVIVSLILLSLAAFALSGVINVDGTNYHPFVTHGDGGILAATGFVFVSCASVTKIASVAEEVENPGRNVPIATIASVALMMLVYTLIVFVMIGVSPSGELIADDVLAPMALAARQFGGPWARTRDCSRHRSSTGEHGKCGRPLLVAVPVRNESGRSRATFERRGFPVRNAGHVGPHYGWAASRPHRRVSCSRLREARQRVQYPRFYFHQRGAHRVT